MKAYLLYIAFILPSATLAKGMPVVTVVPVKAVRTTNTERVVGQLTPSKLVALGFELGGRLATSKVQKGDYVQAGQLLGSLNTDIIDAQVAQAEATLAAAQASAALAKDVAARNKKLKKGDSVSTLQSMQMETKAKATEAQQAQAQAGLRQAKAGQRRHYLRASFSGTVIDAPDNVGGIVGPGMPIYILMQLNPLTLKAIIPEKLRGQIAVGQKARITAVGSDATTDDAIIKVLLPAADPKTRRIPIEVHVPNGDGRFVANTLARLTLHVDSPKHAVIIPATALAMMGGMHVFTITDGGILKRIPVQVLQRITNQVTIVPAEPIRQVVEYPSTLAEGIRVTQR